MPVKDLHDKPFTEETITKLEIFEKYVESWIPVFINHPLFSEVTIYDFFAGSGQDTNGIPGSPLRILIILEIYQEIIIKNKFRIKVVLNEFKKKKYLKLKSLIEDRLKTLPQLNGFIEIKFYNQDFNNLFFEEHEKLSQNVNLIFLDQNGIKQVNAEVFSVLESLQTTDFLFFISSSFFKRFAKEFRKYFPHLDIKKIKDANYVQIHQVILDEYKKLLPASSKTVLYPFSIKKGANIYGLIFGTKHPRAVDKFLQIAWNKNKLNGQANFDIDDDIDKKQTDLFEVNLTKIEKFQADLKILLLSKNVTNCDIYNYTLEKGHIPAHSVAIVKKLKEENKINYNGHPRINYKNCYREQNIIYFERVKNEKK